LEEGVYEYAGVIMLEG